MHRANNSLRFPQSPFAFSLVLIIAGIIGGLSIAIPLLWPFVFLTLIPLIDLTYRKEITLGASFILGWLYGCVLIGTTLYWIFNALPADWAGIHSPMAAFFITMFVWLVITIVGGAFIDLWVIAVKLSVRRQPTDIVLVAVSWVIFEYLRMCGITLLAWGPGSILAPYFSFGMLGYALANSNALLQLARPGGVFALSLTVALVSFLLWAWLFKKWEIIPKPLTASFIGLVSITYMMLCLFPFKAPHSPLSVVTLSTDFPSTLVVSNEEQSSEVSEIEKDLETIGRSGNVPDVIVLPEDMRFIETLTVQGKDPASYLRSIFGKREALIVDSARVTGFIGTHGQITFFSSTRGVVAIRNKLILTPIGEYTPTTVAWGMRLFGMSAEVQAMQGNRDYLPGDTPQGVEYHGATLIALLCSEMVSPTLYYDATRNSVDPILLNLSSQSIFHDSGNPYAELREMALVHSVWSDAPYFQSTNGGAAVRIGN